MEHTYGAVKAMMQPVLIASVEKRLVAFNGLRFPKRHKGMPGIKKRDDLSRPFIFWSSLPKALSLDLPPSL